MNYHHLDQNERNLIQYFFNAERISISKIARRLGKNKSTIARELKRNSFNGFYDAELADKKAFNRHRNKYFCNNQKYHEFSNLFHQYFDKRYFGIKATYHLIETKFPNVKKSCLRQVFNLIKGYKWILTPKDCLHHYSKNEPKRRREPFPNLMEDWFYQSEFVLSWETHVFVGVV